MNSDFVPACEVSEPGPVTGAPGPNLLITVIVFALTVCTVVWIAICQPVLVNRPATAAGFSEVQQ